MTSKFTLYVPDEEKELAEWIDDVSEVFGSESAVLKQAVKHFKREKGEELESLIGNVDDDEGTNFV